jgi:hypothetical protein
MLLLVNLALAGSPDGPDNPYVLGPSQTVARMGTSDSWAQGYGDGRRDGEERPRMQPLVMGAGAGLVLGGTGSFSCGLCCGAPLIAAGCVVPPIVSAQRKPTPPPGPWETADADYQSGYIEGYQRIAGQRQTRAAIWGGVAGTAVGALLGTGALYAVQQIWFPERNFVEF